jgi:hypothetical protein
MTLSLNDYKRLTPMKIAQKYPNRLVFIRPEAKARFIAC